MLDSPVWRFALGKPWTPDDFVRAISALLSPLASWHAQRAIARLWSPQVEGGTRCEAGAHAICARELTEALCHAQLKPRVGARTARYPRRRRGVGCCTLRRGFLRPSVGSLLVRVVSAQRRCHSRPCSRWRTNEPSTRSHGGGSHSLNRSGVPARIPRRALRWGDRGAPLASVRA